MPYRRAAAIYGQLRRFYRSMTVCSGIGGACTSASDALHTELKCKEIRRIISGCREQMQMFWLGVSRALSENTWRDLISNNVGISF